MKSKTVWKLVSIHNDEMVSAFYWNYDGKGLTLTYAMNQKTTSHIGKIFVFETLKDVINFKGSRDAGSRILQGEAEGISRLKLVSCYNDKIAEFWERKKKKTRNYNTKEAPKGTLVCDSFTPRVIEFVCP